MRDEGQDEKAEKRATESKREKEKERGEHTAYTQSHRLSESKIEKETHSVNIVSPNKWSASFSGVMSKEVILIMSCASFSTGKMTEWVRA